MYVPLESGSYYAVETEAGKGFQLDNTPIYFAVEDGKTTTKTVPNKAISGILIHKVDLATGEGIYGVSFLLYDLSLIHISELWLRQEPVSAVRCW